MQYAISYKRFSTPKQVQGDSRRRQAQLAERYCQQHKIKLLDTYLDEGLSAFKGEHLRDNGALTALLDQAKAGKFPPGTLLIVESLDRLSRLEMTTALRLFLDILDTGLVIVTLIDGEQVFTKGRADADPTALMFATLILSRANNQAKTNQERVLEAWRTARRRAREHKIPTTGICPAWLSVVGKRNNRRFVINQQRAQVVSQIFQLAISGMGQEPITRFLNLNNIPTMSGVPKWRRGMVANIFRNRAVLGIYEPFVDILEDGHKRRIPDPDGPIEGYYPAIISHAEYNEYRRSVETRKRCHNDVRGRPFSNLATRLGRCSTCGDTIDQTRHNAGYDYLRCTSSQQKECTNMRSFPYHTLEPLLLVFDDLMEIISRLVPAREGEREVDRRVSQLRASIARAKAKLARSAIAVGEPVSAQIAKQRGRIAWLEDKLLEAERDAYRADPLNRVGTLARFKAAKMRAQSAQKAERHAGREEFAAVLRKLIEGVVLHGNRILTIHTKLEVMGYQVIYALSPDGLQGIQVKSPEGTTGFIGPSLFRGVMRSVRLTRRGQDGRTDEPLWQSVDIEELVRRVHVVRLPNGDWQALVSEPTQIDELARQGERALTFRSRLLKRNYSSSVRDFPS